MITESDWKKFKMIKEQALQDLSQRILQNGLKIIEDGTDTFHERYLRLYDHIQDGNNDMARAFDGHSRSRATMQLMLMRQQDLVSEEAVSSLSDELQQHSKPR